MTDAPPPSRAQPPADASPGSGHAWLRTVGLNLILAALYLAAAKLGLRLAFVNPSATAVWPPTGITLAALLVLGPRVWPGIALGAFVANVTTAGSLATSAGITAGNTLEGLAGAWLVSRWARGPNAMQRPQDIFKFAGLAAGLSTMVSATAGVTSLALGGYARWSDLGSIWTTWWLGDAVGDLIVAPTLLLWSSGVGPLVPRRRTLEAACFGLAFIATGWFFFHGIGVRNAPLGFVWIPILVWAAFRFGPRATATAMLGVFSLAVWGTAHGLGPFALPSPNTSLLLLQVYMGVVSVMGLTLAAEVSQRERATDALRRSRDQLERRVEERTGDLSRLIESLSGEILERLRTEKRLSESERDLARAQGVAHVGSWSWDIVANRVAWSDELYRIYGLAPQSVPVTYESFLFMVHPEDRLLVEETVGRSHRTGGPFSFEHRIVQPGGSVRWVHGRGEVEMGPDGPVRMHGTGRDITERRQADTERRRLEKEILEAGEREREQVGRDLHDDLGQVLTGIAFLSKALEDRLAEQSPEEATAATEILGLVEQAIEKTRLLARGLAPVALEPEGLGAAIQELAAVTKRIFGVTCTFAQADPIGVEGSLVATNLYRIAQEAVINAVRHGHAGKIEISLVRDGGNLTLAVRDDGVGTDPGAHTGNGLGLRIMSYRATLIGGALDIQSGSGGTTVVCTVPGVARPAGKRVGAPRRRAGARSQPQRPSATPLE